MTPTQRQSRGRRTTQRAAAAFAVGLVGATTLPASSSAARLPASGEAKVVSVDGPARLTIATKVRKKTLNVPLRLIGVDAPNPATGTQPAECGATESTAGLARAAKKHGKAVAYSLYTGSGKRFVRDSAGRLLARVDYEYKMRDGGETFIADANLEASVISAGWARGGFAMSLTQASEPLTGETAIDELERTRPVRAVGVWAKCGGRMHLPGNVPVPPSQPAVWSIDANGVTQTVGPIRLSASLTPDSTLTMARLATLVPDFELIDHDRFCFGVIPSLQLMAMGFHDEGDDTETTSDDAPMTPCGATAVVELRSYGPGIARSDRGLKSGDAAKLIPGFFPLVRPADAKNHYTSDEDWVLLSGSAPYRPWAWKSAALLGFTDNVLGLATSPLMF